MTELPRVLLRVRRHRVHGRRLPHLPQLQVVRALQARPPGVPVRRDGHRPGRVRAAQALPRPVRVLPRREEHHLHRTRQRRRNQGKRESLLDASLAIWKRNEVFAAFFFTHYGFFFLLSPFGNTANGSRFFDASEFCRKEWGKKLTQQKKSVFLTWCYTYFLKKYWGILVWVRVTEMAPPPPPKKL